MTTHVVTNDKEVYLKAILFYDVGISTHFTIDDKPLEMKLFSYVSDVFARKTVRKYAHAKIIRMFIYHI